MYKDSANEWTSGFVRNNKDLCFSVLKEKNETVIKYLQNGSLDSYKNACITLNEMMNGAVTIQEAGIANMRPFISSNSFHVGIIVLFGCTDYPEQKRRETAIAAFEDCKDFSNGSLVKYAEQIIGSIKANKSLEDIKNETFPDFPNDVIELLSITPQKLEQIKNTPSVVKHRSKKGCIRGLNDTKKHFFMWLFITLGIFAAFAVGIQYLISLFADENEIELIKTTNYYIDVYGKKIVLQLAISVILYIIVTFPMGFDVRRKFMNWYAHIPADEIIISESFTNPIVAFFRLIKCDIAIIIDIVLLCIYILSSFIIGIVIFPYFVISGIIFIISGKI